MVNKMALVIFLCPIIYPIASQTLRDLIPRLQPWLRTLPTYGTRLKNGMPLYTICCAVLGTGAFINAETEVWIWTRVWLWTPWVVEKLECCLITLFRKFWSAQARGGNHSTL